MSARRSFLQNEPPFAGQLLTIGVGALGAFLFRWFDIPGGALSGGMAAVALMTIPGLATAIGAPLRTVAMVLSGLSFGSAVTPETLRSVAAYPLSLAIMTLSAFVMTAISSTLLTKLNGWNRATAFLASTPGGFSTALIFAATTDANVPRIVVVQMFRVVFLMAILPLIVSQAGVHIASQIDHLDDPWTILAIMVPPGMALGFALDRLRIAGGMLLGVMIVSAAFHALSIAPGRPPNVIILISQILIGSWIGSRFVGFNWRTLGGMIGPAMVSVGCSLIISAIFAVMTAELLNVPFSAALVAFAPGAFEAMTMLAFALGLDPLYTVAHHLWRFLVMTFVIPFAVRIWLKDSIVQASSRSFR
jgi:membrane AbrB-like protein